MVLREVQEVKRKLKRGARGKSKDTYRLDNHEDSEGRVGRRRCSDR